MSGTAGDSSPPAGAPAVSTPASTWRKLGLLSLLYLAQGLPFGFQAKALPVYLRETGVSLTTIGFATALAAPWGFKALWAPWVERYWLPSLGRRKTWILPTQLAMVVCCLLAALLPQAAESLMPLLVLVFLMNFFAATMDIAVDGLAVDILSLDELGLGNSAQVVGYKFGMLFGGGVLVWASASLGWPGLFASMAAMIVGVAVAVWFWDEPPPPRPVDPTPLTGATTEDGRLTLGQIFRKLWAALRVPGGAWLLLFVAVYKAGESVVDVMWFPYLVDSGFTREQISLWAGVYGMGFSLGGSLLGGVLSTVLPLWRALLVACVLRLGPMLLQWMLASGLVAATPTTIPLAIWSEAVTGGALTVAMFALMMARVDRSIGAMHYTLLACVEVHGKGLCGMASGVLAQQLGYGALFGWGVVLSALCLPLLLPLRIAPVPDVAPQPPPDAA